MKMMKLDILSIIFVIAAAATVLGKFNTLSHSFNNAKLCFCRKFNLFLILPYTLSHTIAHIHRKNSHYDVNILIRKISSSIKFLLTEIIALL